MFIAETAYQPIRGCEEWYGPKEETVRAMQTACHTLVEAAMKANQRYYLDERDRGLFFQI